VSYQIGADTGNATRFGIMELKESYEEKYLLGFGMHSGEMITAIDVKRTFLNYAFFYYFYKKTRV